MTTRSMRGIVKPANFLTSLSPSLTPPSLLFPKIQNWPYLTLIGHLQCSVNMVHFLRIRRGIWYPVLVMLILFVACGFFVIRRNLMVLLSGIWLVLLVMAGHRLQVWIAMRHSAPW